ncbi:MAG: hypothetical protein GY845_30405 [Planctomycetes bacterium]|nr:hypothetical protein [Planctomycetota bacterium]
MSDLILTKDKKPFETEQAANLKKGKLKKEGIIAKVVEHEGGYALKELPQLPRRRKKGRLGRRNVLAADPNAIGKGFVGRFVNDVPGRIEQLEGEDWEVVKGDVETADSDIKVTSQLGSVVSRPVGGGMRGVLMRKKKEYHEEDQAEKKAVLDKIDQAILNPDKSDGMYDVHTG